MNVILKYRGRLLTSEDVSTIKQLIADHPHLSRRALSIKLCQVWNWVQPNGVLRDAVCRGLLLALHREGYIRLPEPRMVLSKPPGPPPPPPEVIVDRAAIEGSLAWLGPLTFEQVRKTAQEPLFNSLIQQHHYLGYVQPVGEHLKYLISARQRPIACLTWCSAPRHLGCRDRYIGWDAPTRRHNIHLIAYNPRFLILPWVRVPHLASHVLGRMTRMLPAQWQKYYAHPVHFVETFVDSDKYRGTCYRAANWTLMGKTTGRGHNNPTKQVTTSIKEVLGYPLRRDFRRLLCQSSSCPKDTAALPLEG